MTSTSSILSRRLFVGGSLGATGLVLLSACTSTTVLAPVENGTVLDQTDAALPLVNAVRGKQGLARLAGDPAAESAARDQAVRMSRYGEMKHVLGVEKTFLARMKRMEVRLPAAENIAEGQDDVDEAVSAWIRSKKHLENMLGNYRGLGVAVARNTGTGNRPYWAMVLSNPEDSFFSRSA